MAFVTFSGPIRSGTVRYGANKNVGLVDVMQTATVTFAAMTTAPTAQPICILPAGSKILEMNVEVTTAISGGGVTNVAMVLGTLATPNLYFTTFNKGLTSAKVAQATIDAAQVVANTDNIGTADVPVYATFTAATGNPTAGQTVVTIRYIQRAADGTANPVSAN